MLSPYRVLDLTDARAELGSMILADLGADVIIIEPPGGSASRRMPPLDPRLPPALRSLHFHAFNRNKRSVVLDLETDAGKRAFLDLVRDTDFVFENAQPGVMAARGLGFEDLRAVNSRLVYVAITPFGQDGPYAGHLTTDLTLAAMGGMAAVNGDADRPPVRISVPQTWLHASAESAIAALVAHNRCLATGEAQFVDVSVQTAVFWTTLHASIAAAIQGRDFERAATLMQLGLVSLQTMYACKDGSAVLFVNRQALPIIVRWLVEEGVVPDSWLTDEDWSSYEVRMLSQEPLVHPLPELTARIGDLARRFTKAELFERGQAAGFFIAPSNTVADVLDSEHLAARDYWQPLPLPDGRMLRRPGPFVRLSRTPITYRRETPEADEGRVSSESSVVSSGGQVARNSLQSSNPPTGYSLLATHYPFEGIRVADFSWIGVGPITAKYLADHGAETVRVETSQPPDRLRVAGPFKDGVFGHNRSQFFAAFNTSKRSLALNLKTPEGRAVAKRLIAWADVYLESFTAGTVADLGLGYDVARELNPSIIMVSTCLMGQSGPASPLAGYGTHAAAISGFTEVTGWPDRLPGGPFTAYTDTIAPRFLAATIMAALDHRRRTGEGQFIEQAQIESALYFLAPELLDYQVSGKVATRMGNDAPDAAPHGIYPCLGDDEWCAIAVETDEQWRALRRTLGEPEWAVNPALDTTAGRLAARRALDERLAEWTRAFEPLSLMERLQVAGVPAGMVQRSSDLLRDPQLVHRRFFRPMTHPEMGEVPYEGHQFRIRGYDSGPRFPAPCLGEHSVEILRDVLGMTDEEIAEVAASGTLA